MLVPREDSPAAGTVAVELSATCTLSLDISLARFWSTGACLSEPRHTMIKKKRKATRRIGTRNSELGTRGSGLFPLEQAEMSLYVDKAIVTMETKRGKSHIAGLRNVMMI